mgnify:FL=1
MDDLSRRQNKFIRKVVALSSAGVFLDGYDLFIISVALIFIESQGWLSTNSSMKSIQMGLLNSSALVGMFVGALIVGNYADKIGRRALYVIDLVFFVFFGLLTALATNITELILFRFFLGIGIGADYPVSSTYVAEFSPKKTRGKLVTTTFMFWGIGSILAAIIGFSFGRFEYIDILGYHVDSWRLMLASGIIPAFIVLLLRHTMPESPRWLLSNSRKEEANKIINDIREKYGLDYSQDLSLVEPERKGKVSELLGPKYRRRTLFAWIPWFFMDIGVYGVGISIPYILENIGFKGTTIIDKVNSIFGTVILDIFILIGFVFAIFIIEKIGRLKLQEIGFIGMGISLIALGLYYYNGLAIVMAALAMYLLYENAGPNVTTWVIPTEIFPTRLRATAQGTSSAVSRLGAIIGTFFFPVLVFAYGWSFTFFLIAVVMFLGFLFTLILGIEAKGLTLEESSKLFLEFSKFLDELSTKVMEAAKELKEMVEKYDNLDQRAQKIKEIEHEADSIVHKIYTRVNYMNKPLESVDVGMLATKYDDILDFINAVSKRIILFRVQKTQEMVSFADVILASVEEVNKALKYFGDFDEGDFDSIIKECVRINELENEADDLLANSLEQVFVYKNPVEIIKYKELYEYMEIVTDKCEDVSDIFRDMVVKYS